MANFGKAARLILVATAPMLAMAQSPQVKPSPQVRPAATAPSGTAATPAPRTQPAPAPNSQRFVTSENFFRARPKPQPASPASTNGQPVAPSPAVVRNSNPALQSRPAVPQSIQSTAASLPVMPKPQPALVQPVLITGSSASAPGHDSSAAVEYASGQLTVVSDNAPLSFVLKLVAAKTGAVVDLAPELQNEPVAARLGPAPVREVLTGLLDSPRIDYIVLGTGDEPGSLQRIVVRTRRSFGQVAMAAVHPPQPKQEETEDEEKLDQNGHLLSTGQTPAEAQLTQQQLMENWKKIREEKLQAEIKQQAEDREREKTQPPDQPAQDNPAPDNAQQSDPPQR